MNNANKAGLLNDLPPVPAPEEGEAPPPGARRPRRRTSRSSAPPRSAVTLSVPDDILYLLEQLVTERRRRTGRRNIYLRDLVVEAVTAHFGAPKEYEEE